MSRGPATSTPLRGARLAVGLLTVLPVGPVDADRRTVRTALQLAPVVGLALGATAWLAGAVVLRAGGGALVAAVTSVGVLAIATRGLHLDGLADLADGLGSAKDADGALEVMRKADVGPFGVATLVLVLLLQVAVLAEGWARDLAGPMLVLACLTGRIALLWACRAGVPAARADGLGALVSGAVPRTRPVLLTAAACAGAAVWGGSTGDGSAAALALGVLGGVAAALLLQRRAVRRLGGVTGDVLGALVETGTTATLLALLLLM